MKKLLALLVLLLGTTTGFATDLPPLSITDFSCGLVTTLDSSAIGDGCSQDLRNVDLWSGEIKPRRGTVKQNSASLTGNQPIRFLHEFVDSSGNVWILSVSSNTIFGSKTGGVTNQIITSTFGITSDSNFSAVNAYNKAYLTDGTTNVIIFDGINITASTSIPHGTAITFAFERIFVAGVTGSRSTLYASAFGDPEDWFDNGVADDDSYSENIRKDDGYVIRGLFRFKDQVVVAKDFSMDSLTEPDGLNPSLTSLSSIIGTSQPKSAQLTDNEFIFLGRDGFYEYDGVSLRRISDVITPTAKGINSTASENSELALTTQSDFAPGLSTYTTSAISAGSVVQSTTALLQSTFNSGTFTPGMSSSVSAGVLTSTLSLVDDFSDGVVTWNTGTSGIPTISETGGYLTTSYTGACKGGTDCFTYMSTSSFSASKRTYISVPFKTGVNLGSAVSESFSIFIGTGSSSLLRPSHRLWLAFDKSGTGTNVALAGLSAASITTDIFDAVQRTISFNYDGANIAVYLDSTLVLSAVTPLTVDISSISFFDQCYYAVTGCLGQDHKVGAVQYIPITSTYTSTTFDTRRYTPQQMNFSAGAAVGSGNLSYAVYVDSDASISPDTASTWLSSQTVTAGNVSLPNGRYLTYRAYFTNAYLPLAQPSLDDVTLDVKATTGSYKTPNTPLSSISSWRPITIEAPLNGGAMSFVLYTDTDTSMNLSVTSSYISSQTIVSGDMPYIATATYAAIAYTSTITAYANDPSLDTVLFSWTTGSPIPAASIYYDGDYLCAVRVSSTVVNDKVFVYDRNHRWTIYRDLNVGSMLKSRGLPYYGSGVTGDIFRMQADNVFSDNGVGITSEWISKDFDFTVPYADKTTQRYYVTGAYGSNQDAVFAYGVNEGNLTPVILDLDRTPGTFRQTIIPNSLTYQRGALHRFSVGNSDPSQTFSIDSVTILERLETAP